MKEEQAGQEWSLTSFTLEESLESLAPCTGSTVERCWPNSQPEPPAVKCVFSTRLPGPQETWAFTWWCW